VAGVGSWYRREQALRTRSPLPAPSALSWPTALIVLVGALVAVSIGIAWVDGDR
jgi:hypothetical protein